MEALEDCPLAHTLAERLRGARAELTARWLERIAARVALHPNRVFPTDELLDHVPLLMLGIADYIDHPANEITADVPVVAKAMELGELRHAQGFDVYEILKEYEIFGGIIYNFFARTVDTLEEPCSRSELLFCAHRLFRAVAVIQQATTTQYLQKMGEQIREREERLRAFNRAITHEFRNQIGAALGAGQLLDLEGLTAEERRQLTGVIVKNVDGMRTRLDALLDLTRLDASDTRRQRHVKLPQAVFEVTRSLRDAAEARGVDVRVGSVPPIEVHAAAVELCLSNYVSNAIKYADPSKPERWVEISGRIRVTGVGAGLDAGDGTEVVVEVRDNGLGVPQAQRAGLFQRFVRAHDQAITGVEGVGLGLSIVRETVESLNGQAWAEFPDEGGSVFAFSLPLRRQRDAAMAATPGLAAPAHR
ncbi:MAG TPA: HAMP domain-containing sensor histidine kinase [Gemmatimonadaceae bacterium]|nr:HAMP domain-containing sensor histidine kinase [Gemmatimonadaceae bacterium]